jgi:hypothetical protein
LNPRGEYHHRHRRHGFRVGEDEIARGGNILTLGGDQQAVEALPMLTLCGAWPSATVE